MMMTMIVIVMRVMTRSQVQGNQVGCKGTAGILLLGGSVGGVLALYIIYCM